MASPHWSTTNRRGLQPLTYKHCYDRLGYVFNKRMQDKAFRHISLPQFYWTAASQNPTCLTDILTLGNGGFSPAGAILNYLKPNIIKVRELSLRSQDVKMNNFLAGNAQPYIGDCHDPLDFFINVPDNSIILGIEFKVWNATIDISEVDTHGNPIKILSSSVHYDTELKQVRVNSEATRLKVTLHTPYVGPNRFQIDTFRAFGGTRVESMISPIENRDR